MCIHHRCVIRHVPLLRALRETRKHGSSPTLAKSDSLAITSSCDRWALWSPRDCHRFSTAQETNDPANYWPTNVSIHTYIYADNSSPAASILRVLKTYALKKCLRKISFSANNCYIFYAACVPIEYIHFIIF